MTLKRFALITMIRNEPFFLPKWIAYYGGIFGFENLYVVNDGYDQPRPECEGSDQVNFLSVPHKTQSRVQGDRTRSNFTSHLSKTLFRYYDAVIYVDADEFLVVDPNSDTDLRGFLSAQKPRISAAALGVDIIHDPASEPEFDGNQLYLEQRQFGVIDATYTKPSVLYKPARRGGGGHRLKYLFSRIVPDLYLFHFGLIDYQRSLNKLGSLPDNTVTEADNPYLRHRQTEFKDAANLPVQDWENIIPNARHYQTWRRSWKRPLNPGKMPEKPRIQIPERFRSLL